jgi:serine protease Do
MSLTRLTVLAPTVVLVLAAAVFLVAGLFVAAPAVEGWARVHAPAPDASSSAAVPPGAASSLAATVSVSSPTSPREGAAGSVAASIPASLKESPAALPASVPASTPASSKDAAAATTSSTAAPAANAATATPAADSTTKTGASAAGSTEAKATSASSASTAATPTSAPAAEKSVSLDAAKAVEQAIEHAADRVGPSVVNILITREATAMLGMDDADTRTPLPDDMKDFTDRTRRGGRVPYRTQGNGSGVIMSSDGFILTSEHVVHDAVEIEVTLATRKRFRARVVGTDPRRDLAVIRIDAKDLPAAKLGDAAALRRGQFVLALGSPFGFGRDGQASVSFGIVSGLGRAISGVGRELDRYYGNLVQTDAAVNPGNSGGPLVNLDGEVIGVNAVISSQTGASDGVGFAVPITSTTRSLIDRLKKGETIAYGFLGVEIQEVGEAESRESGADTGEGAFVTEVLADTPGAKAGLHRGDVVVRIGEQAVHGPDDVIEAVQSTPIGDKLPVMVIRKGKRLPFMVEVARRPAPQDVTAAKDTGDWWRGMRVEPLTADLREQIGLADADRGVFVREVKDGSAAAKAGIIPGMVVDQVAGKSVISVREFKTAVGPVDGPCSLHVFGIGAKIVPLAATAPGKTAPEAKAGDSGKP